MASDGGYTVTQDQAPRGWYQESDGSWRYWDGAAWTCVSPAVSNVWPAPTSFAKQASRTTSPSIGRGQAALATVCILLGLVFLGAMVQQPKGRTVVFGTTLAPRADASSTFGTSAPAATFTVTAPSKSTPAITVARVEITVLAEAVTAAPTMPRLETSTTTATAAVTVAPATAVVTTVAPTSSPTYSQEQIAYFEAVERAAQSATSTTRPEVVAPSSVGCGSDSYTNTNGNCVLRPIAAPTAPAGATARCSDGTYSFSQNRRGTCSGHKGVAEWL
jgi:Protein of unknown function (DUF3761)